MTEFGTACCKKLTTACGTMRLPDEGGIGALPPTGYDSSVPMSIQNLYHRWTGGENPCENNLWFQGEKAAV